MNKVKSATTLREAISIWFQEGGQGKILGPQGKITIKSCSNGCCDRGAVIGNLLAGLPLFSVLGDKTGKWEFCGRSAERVLKEWNNQW